MKKLDLKDAILQFKPDHIIITFLDKAHFDIGLFNECLSIKKDIYQDKKIGIITHRKIDTASYSFNPMLLICKGHLFKKHIKWVAVVGNNIDYLNLQYIKKFTKIPNEFFEEIEPAMQWISSRD